MKITFTNVLGVAEDYKPQPSFQLVPDWYKKTESYVSGEKKPSGDGGNVGTIKRCMPVFDAINSGYIIVSASDVFVSQKETEAGGKQPWFEWSSFDLISFHPIIQAPLHPNRNGHMAYPKWNNSWGIKTPKGYSTLFVQPMHRESPFTILPGVVDTDEYCAPILFPFVLNDITFEGLIPAGTPIAQVIPFKRDKWEMEFGTQKNFIEQNNVTIRLKSKFFDGYKSLFRQPKEYR